MRSPDKTVYPRMHPCSYAYDGKRVRKWSVKCLPYGQAWAAGVCPSCCVGLFFLSCMCATNQMCVGRELRVLFATACPGARVRVASIWSTMVNNTSLARRRHWLLPGPGQGRGVLQPQRHPAGRSLHRRARAAAATPGILPCRQERALWRLCAGCSKLGEATGGVPG